MDYPVRMLATGYGPPGQAGDPPTLSVVRSEEAWQELVAAQHTLANQADLTGPDWAREVLLWARAGGAGDSSQEIRIEGLSREGDTARVRASLVLPTNAQDLDFLASPWGLAVGAREAFADAAQIDFGLDGRSGTVETLP